MDVAIGIALISPEEDHKTTKFNHHITRLNSENLKYPIFDQIYHFCPKITKNHFFGVYEIHRTYEFREFS